MVRNFQTDLDLDSVKKSAKKVIENSQFKSIVF